MGAVAMAAAVLLAASAGAIYKGYSADEARFPWLVTLTLRGAENCGGALIAPNVAVTAAHCVHTATQRRDTRVVFGYKSRHAVSVGIRRVVEHAYDAKTNLNDIAVLLLDWQPSTAVPIDLAPDDPANGTWLTAVGFGCSSQPWVNPKAHCKHFPSHLQGISLQRVRQDCRKMSASDFCVTGGDAGLNHGDSGGPVMLWSGNGWKLAGLVDLDASGTTTDDSAPFFDDVTSIAQQGAWIKSVLDDAGTRPMTWRLTAVGIGPLRLGISEAEARATGTPLTVDSSGPFCDTWAVHGLDGVSMYLVRDSGGLRSIGLGSARGHGPAGVEIGDSIAKLKARLGPRLEHVKTNSQFYRQQHMGFYRLYSTDRRTTLQFTVDTKSHVVTAEEAGYPGDFYYPDGNELCA
jgi:hypothetical protein